VFRLAPLTGYTVLGGPFAGMQYNRKCLLPYSSSGGVLKKLIGGYELECAPFIAKAINAAHPQVVNIGAGEGYYAVGMALASPKSMVLAFEADPYNQDLCADLATLNGVASRVHVLGFCTPELLRDSMTSNSLVICDCEGGEIDILDPHAVPQLLEADILVELHDFINPAISTTIFSRFNKSHRIETCRSNTLVVDHPLLHALSEADRLHFTIDTRVAEMEWAFLSSYSASKKLPSAHINSIPGRTG
jgi:hypothetical protein